jgi:threonine synthase
MLREINKQLYLLDESGGPTGTHKDRRAAAIVAAARTKGVRLLYLVSSGNAGLALAKAAQPFGIEVRVLLDDLAAPEVRTALIQASAQVMVVNLRGRLVFPEEIAEMVGVTAKDTAWDVSSGWEMAYRSMARELQELRPARIFCPIGTGELYVGLARGLADLGMTSVVMIGARPEQVPSLADKLSAYNSPYESEIINLGRSSHHVMTLTEQEIKDAYREFSEYTQCEPSAATAWAAYRGWKGVIGPDDVTVVVNTGRGIY